MVAFEIVDRFGKEVSLNEEREAHILSRPEMKNQEDKIKETLLNPDKIRESLRDESTWLYYKKYPKTPVTEKHMLVVVKVLNNEGEVITAFYTDRIKKGEVVWKKD